MPQVKLEIFCRPHTVLYILVGGGSSLRVPPLWFLRVEQNKVHRPALPPQSPPPPAPLDLLLLLLPLLLLLLCRLYCKGRRAAGGRREAIFLMENLKPAFLLCFIHSNLLACTNCQCQKSCDLNKKVLLPNFWLQTKCKSYATNKNINSQINPVHIFVHCTNFKRTYFKSYIMCIHLMLQRNDLMDGLLQD